jgi:hypothetical protein
MTVWAPVAAGDDIKLSPGDRVALVASVDITHSLAELASFASARGILLDDLADETTRTGLGPDPRAPGYKYVAAEGLASQEVTLPWSVPWPLSMMDGSQLVAAWTAPPGAAPPTPTPPAPTRPAPALLPSMLPLLWLTAVALAFAASARVRVYTGSPILDRARR